MRKENISRFMIFLFVGAIHLVILLFFAFNVNVKKLTTEPSAQVMKLLDIIEDIPLPPPPPPKTPPVIQQNTIEALATTMIETEEIPPDIEITTDIIQSQETVVYQTQQTDDFLPMNKISVPPSFSEKDIKQVLEYPAIALKSGIEGVVFLELFVDKQGIVKQVKILKEDPAGKGFGEAASKAFQGMHCVPAQANGNPVAVRYRYPVRFTIK